METNQLEIKKTILLQDYTIINSSIKEMKLDDIKDSISNLVASNTDLNDSKYIRTEMEEITGYGNTKEMENGAISTLILESKEDTELKNKFSFVNNILLFPNLITELENKFPEYKDKIENSLENSDKIEVEFPNINDDFFELEKAYTKEVEVLKKAIKERIYNGVENIMGEMVSIVKMNSFLEEQTPLYLQQELQYRTFQTKELLEKDDSYLLITELKDNIKKHLPDVLENVEGIKSINTETFREKMENLLLKTEKENIEEKQKTHFKEKEKEL